MVSDILLLLSWKKIKEMCQGDFPNQIKHQTLCCGNEIPWAMPLQKWSQKKIVKAGLLPNDLMRQFFAICFIYCFDFLLKFVPCGEINPRVEHLIIFWYLWRIPRSVHCYAPLVIPWDHIYTSISGLIRLCQKALTAAASWLLAWVAPCH